MQNELRYYLELVKTTIEDDTFKPTYIITVVKQPWGALEVAVNTSHILEKIIYILSAYDEDMKLTSNQEISMTNLMVV